MLTRQAADGGAGGGPGGRTGARRFDFEGCLPGLVSCLSTPNPRERPADACAAADAVRFGVAGPMADFITCLKLWHAPELARESLTQPPLRVLSRERLLPCLR